MSCYDVIHTLLKAGAIEVNEVQDDLLLPDETFSENSDLVVTKLGRAATQGGLDIAIAIRLHQDLELAARSMVMMGSLHLLYLVTPYDMHEIKPDYRLYYNLYTNLSEEGVRTAAVLGITEGNAVKMMTGKPINNVPKDVLCRFYTALILHDLWKHESRPVVAQKFAVSRGLLQSLLARAAAFASSAHRFCAELEHLWPFRALLAGLLPLMHGVDLDGKSG